MKNESQLADRVHAPDAFRVMPVAAIFEEEFSVDWLEELTGLRATSILAVLETAAEKRELTRKEPGIYAFAGDRGRKSWLALVQKKDKERYYRAVASTLLKEPGNDDEKALRVSGYLRHIPNDTEGCRWLVKAGEAYNASSTEMAIRCFTKVADDLADKQGEIEDSLFVTAVLGYSNATTLRTNTLKTLSLLNEAKVRAKRLGNEDLVLLTEMYVAKHEWLRSHDTRAVKRFEAALATIEKTKNPELVAATTDLKNYFLFWQGRFRDVIATYEKSLSDVEHYPSGPFPVFAAITVARSYAITGQLTQGLGMLHTIYDRCMEKRNIYLACHAASAIAILFLGIGRFEDAFKYFKSSLRQAVESENHYVKLIVTFMLALAHKRKGEKKVSLRYLRRFLKHLRESHVSAQLYPYLMEICWDMEVGTFPSVPGLSLEHEIKGMLDISNVLVRGIAYRYQALLGKRKGWSNQRIVQSLNISAKLLEKSGHQMEYARTQLELAHYHLSTGDVRRVERIMKTVSEVLSPINAELIPDELRPFVCTPNRKESVLAGVLSLDAATIAAAREKNQLLRLIVATINRLIGAERGAILLMGMEASSSGAHLKAAKNLTAEQVCSPGFSPSMRIIREVVLSRKGRVFAIGPSEETGPEHAETIHSGICVPFFLEDESTGVLYHDNRLLSNVFSGSDLKLLEFFAGMVATELGWAKCRQDVRMSAHASRAGTVAIEESGTDEHAAYTDGIIGVSPAIQRIRAEIARVAKTDATVLVLGETGVGKNLVASAIHRQSARAHRALVTVQCSALTESLITSELFGHEKGAFTGATSRRVGRFEMADGGTLFLDEIGDLSAEVQARLLRVLQSKEFERVGGGRETLTSDFRLIAATNRDLEDDVEANRFRRDLYYRISVFPLHVPPLRERREDIPLLVRHFLKTYALKSREPIEEIPKGTMDKLVVYDWPGNVREMENTIQRGILLGHGRRFVLPDSGTGRGMSAGAPPLSRLGTFEENERSLILGVLERTRWRIYGPDGAAGVLGMKPTTLYSKLKKLGIRRPTIEPPA